MNMLISRIMWASLVVSGAAAAQEVAPAESAAKPAATKSKPIAEASKATPRTDHLDLDTTVVTGNRELPKVLYIVPWKKAELGDLPSQPFNTLLDEMLQPVDRDVFKREVKYYQAVSNGVGSGAGSTATPKSSAAPTPTPDAK